MDRRGQSKRNRYHKSVGDFVDDLNQQDQSSFDRFRKWAGIRGDLNFESREGRQDDLEKGIDLILHHADGSMPCQDKLRDVSKSKHPDAGKDFGIEVLRFYAVYWNGRLYIFFDRGRDICGIPKSAIRARSDQLFIERDYQNTKLLSELHFSHPAHEKVVVARSHDLKAIASKYALQFVEAYNEEKEGEGVRLRLREAIFGNKGIFVEHYLNARPEGFQLMVRSDVDKKAISIDGNMLESMASIGKMIAYISPTKCHRYMREGKTFIRLEI